MDPQLGNYTLPADNKGILSLLTAIEQAEDHDQPVETSPSKMEKESLSVSADNFSNLNLDSLEMSGDINLANLSLCLICGRNFNVESSSSGMIDINTLIDIPGEDSRSIQSVVQEFIPIDHEDSQGETQQNEDSGYICVECFLLLDGILKLRAQIHEYVTTLKSKHNDWVHTRRKCTKELLEFRLPISILNVRDGILNVREEPEDDSSASSSALSVLDARVDTAPNPAKKSKLQILAETLEEERRSPSSVVESADDFRLPGGDDAGVDSRGFTSSSCDTSLIIKKKTSVMSVTKSIDPAELHQTEKLSDKENEGSCDMCRLGIRTLANKNSKGKLNCDNCSANKGLDKGFGCDECDQKFPSKVKLKKHVSVLHSSKIQSKYSCRWCEQVFTSKQSRTKHENSRHKHEDPRTKLLHSCDECGELFQSYQTLQSHRSRHTGDFAFKCQHCGKGFNNFKLLEEHEHIHTGRKPYACTQCPKSFANRGSLWLHVKKHETEKPYACDYCTKSFGHASHLAVHKRMHTGEKPYVCRICDERFISGSYLKRHMKSHKNEDPFACGLCNMTFQKRSDLSKHGNEEHSGKVVDALPPQHNFKKDESLQLSRIGVELDTDIKSSAGLSSVGEISGGKSDGPGRSLSGSNSLTSSSASLISSSVLPSSTTLSSSSSSTMPSSSTRSKEFLLVDQTDRLLSLPKLSSEDSDFLLPVNILEEDTKESDVDQPIVFIQVSGGSQFQPGFMQ